MKEHGVDKATLTDNYFFDLPGATCILAPVSDCSLLICSPPRPMTEKGTKLPY